MRILLMFCFLLLGSSAVWACGNPLLWAMLFARVPEAKIVYEAELAARADGLVTARTYDADVGQPYHIWSKAWLMTLADEMQPAVNEVLQPGETLTILLSDEVAAVRFAKNEKPRFIAAGGLRTVERYDLITTINALKDAWQDKLSYGELVEHALARSDHSGAEQKLSKLF